MKRLLELLQSFYLAEVARPLPLLRIACWTGLFLWLIPTFVHPCELREVIQFQEYVDPAQMVCVPITYHSTNGFRRDIAAKKADEFRYAWIGGSSLLVSRPSPDGREDDIRFLPTLVQPLLQKTGGRRPFALMYSLQAGRLYDEYLCVLDALSHQPDLLVVELSPVWVYCDKDISFWPNLYADGVRLIPPRPQDWAYYLLLTSPSKMAEGALSPVFSVVNDRYRYYYRFVQLVQRGGGLAHQAAMQPAGDTGQPASPRQSRLWTMPIAFWFMNELEYDRFPDPSVWQEQILLHYCNTSAATANADILDMMLRAIRDSGVPTLIYTAPLNPEAMRNPQVLARIETINAALNHLADSVSNPAVCFWLTNPNHPLKPEDYFDNLHVKSPEKFVEQLADRITRIIPPPREQTRAHEDHP